MSFYLRCPYTLAFPRKTVFFIAPTVKKYHYGLGLNLAIMGQVIFQTASIFDLCKPIDYIDASAAGHQSVLII